MYACALMATNVRIAESDGCGLGVFAEKPLARDAMAFGDVGFSAVVIPRCIEEGKPISTAWDITRRFLNEGTPDWVAELSRNKTLARQVLQDPADLAMFRTVAAMHTHQNVLDVFTAVLTNHFANWQCTSLGKWVSRLNHADDPNACTATIRDSTSGAWCVACMLQRDVAKDEELTIAYGDAYVRCGWLKN